MQNARKRAACAFAASMVLGVASSQPLTTSKQLLSADTLGFHSPFGIRFGHTKCSELATRFGIPLETLQSKGWAEVVEGDWLIGISSFGCNMPDASVTELQLNYTTRNEHLPSETPEVLSEKFLRHLNENNLRWTEHQGLRLDIPTQRSNSFFNSELVVTLWSVKDYLIVNMRAATNDTLRKMQNQGGTNDGLRKIHIQRAAVKPFGVAIGVSTCKDAAATLAAEPVKVRSSALKPPREWVEVRAKNPENFYPAAKLLKVDCFLGPDTAVNSITLLVSDTENNQAAREAYRVLASKYKIAQAGDILPQTSAYARFSADGVEVELDVPSAGQEFSVTYTESELFHSVRQERARKLKSL